MEDYHRLDVSATLHGKDKPGRKWHHSWTLAVYNAYNRHNTWAINFSQENTDPGNPNSGYETYAEKTYLFGIIPSITFNFNHIVGTKELHVNCDSGRLYRPVLRVEDNKLLLTKNHIESIELDDTKTSTVNTIKTWNEFLLKIRDFIQDDLSGNVDYEEFRWVSLKDSLVNINNTIQSLKNTIDGTQEVSSDTKSQTLKVVDKAA